MPPKLCTVILGFPDSLPQDCQNASTPMSPTSVQSGGSAGGTPRGRPSAPPPMRRLAQSGENKIPQSSSLKYPSLGRSTTSSSPSTQQRSQIPSKIDIPLVQCSVSTLKGTNLAIFWNNFRSTVLQFQDVGSRDYAAQLLTACIEKLSGIPVRSNSGIFLTS